jgi:hypothetical protein
VQHQRTDVKPTTRLYRPTLLSRDSNTDSEAEVGNRHDDSLHTEGKDEDTLPETTASLTSRILKKKKNPKLK